MKFIDDGNFTKVGKLLVFVIGFGLIFVSQFLSVKSNWYKIFSLTGLILVYVGILAGKAKFLGTKPFSNDPLGWRKIKETYKKQDDPASDVDEKISK